MSEATAREIPKNVITNPDFKLWRTDTRAIVGGVLLAVCFSATMQITERLDMALTGGILFWFGLTFVNVWFTAAAMNFGLLAGLLAANFNPIIAILTATSPMAPRFFIDNTLYVIPFALLSMYFFRTKGYVDFKTFLLMCAISMAVDSVAFVASWLILFNFSPLVTLGWWALLMTCVIPGALLGYAFNRAIVRSGVVSAA